MDHILVYQQRRNASPARRTARGTAERERGETAMKTMTVMIEWSAIAVALYATLALVLPVEAFAGLV
jgi:hypothetical protein